MADAEKYAAWIVANPDKKGTPEFDTVAAAYKAARGSMSNADFAAVKAEGNIPRPEQFTPSGEKDLSYSNPEILAAHPLVRFAKGVGAPVLGAAQLGANMVGAGGPINRVISESDAMTQRGRAELGSTGIDWWNAGGQVLSPAALAATRLLTATSTPGRVVQGGVLGAAAGATEPVTKLGNYAGQKGEQIGAGAVVGGAIPAALAAALGIGKGVRNVVQPYMGESGADAAAGRLLNDAVGPRREEVIQALKNAEPGVTAGQAANATNSAEFQAIQQIAANRDPSKYFGAGGIEGSQNEARLAAVRSVGKTEADLKAAIESRAANASEKYAEAFKQKVAGDDVLNTLMSRPSMSKVISRAVDLAKEQGKTFKIGEDIPETVISGKIIGERGAPLTQTVVPAQTAQYPVESLHYIKMAMDDLIKNPERFGIGATEARAIGGTKSQFVDWLGSKSGAYDSARRQFAADSIPINRMEIGQYLEKKLVPAIGQDVEGAKQSAATFSQALRDAPGTIKRSTGNPRFESLKDVLSEEEIKTLIKVRDELARDVSAKAHGKAGMEQASRKIGMSVPEIPPSGMFNPKISFARGVYNRVTGHATEKILDDLAKRMDSPQEVARIMEKAKPGERKSIAELLDAINKVRSTSSAN